MSGAGVDEGGETEGRGGDKRRGERDMEGVRVGKSRRVESDLLGITSLISFAISFVFLYFILIVLLHNHSSQRE